MRKMGGAMPGSDRKLGSTCWIAALAVFALLGAVDMPEAHAGAKGKHHRDHAAKHALKKKHRVKRHSTAKATDRTRAPTKTRTKTETNTQTKTEPSGGENAGKRAAPKPAQKADPQQTPQAAMTLDTFLDRLMMAESGGNVYARNARSTALGPFQFIAATWLHLARTAFATETAELKPHEVLELRTDLDFARRAAKAYTEANAAHLIANGHKATFGNLRLAFLVGPGGAVKVLSAKPVTPVAGILGATVVGANPFMRAMTAEDLIARAHRDIAADTAVDTGLALSADAIARAKAAKRTAGPKIAVRCNLSMPSCRRWLALAKRRSARRIKSARRD